MQSRIQRTCNAVIEGNQAKLRHCWHSTHQSKRVVVPFGAWSVKMPEDRLRFILLLEASWFACALYVCFCGSQDKIDKAAPKHDIQGSPFLGRPSQEPCFGGTAAMDKLVVHDSVRFAKPSIAARCATNGSGNFSNCIGLNKWPIMPISLFGCDQTLIFLWICSTAIALVDS